MRLSVIVLFLVSVFIFSSCEFMMKDFNRTPRKDVFRSSVLNDAIANAKYDLSNKDFYTSKDKYSNIVISGTGYIYDHPFSDYNDDDRYRLTGSENGLPIDWMLFLDHPAPKQKDVGEDVQLLTRGKNVRTFAIFLGTEEFLNEDGTKRTLPTFRCIAIYNIDDRNFRTPIWVSNMYK